MEQQWHWMKQSKTTAGGMGYLHWPLNKVCVKFQGAEVRHCKMGSHISMNRGRQGERARKQQEQKLNQHEALERK